MAGTNNPLWNGLKTSRGKINKDFVLKARRDRTFISKYPDMGNVVPSALQLTYKDRFADAVAYARSITNDPEKKLAYKVRPGSTVYHSAIKDYLENN